jgi:hypothetical protein
MVRGERPTLTALILEMIALRHQIAVLDVAVRVVHASAFGIGCFGSCWRGGGRAGETAW